ncbi:hypothetical protein [Ruminiclostridium cellulolyticum]|uniref:Uncharacterized protein n=1 Tax=Ruminiclostridium cellulolyticum (strain ATCC 35319 / DSM 5812 / JCM 6584 / H10) TaxID=394503 RepID=B8I4G9_RUMCH|nr:hypothetical protein [Ruminiclostridium cellulolyticum]ACL74523.1 hypothetical protein Ccel_0135 [Ruminiclostridium cellulolyticum H10]
MVKKNEYPRKNYVKADGQVGQQSTQSTTQQKVYQKDSVRSTRPPRDQHKDGFQPRENNQQKREFNSRDNSQRENSGRESGSYNNQHRENNYQRNYHRENYQGRENRESNRQHYQRTAIRPRAEETVEDIENDIVRIQKEIDLELKEIRSMRLGV